MLAESCDSIRRRVRTRLTQGNAGAFCDPKAPTGTQAKPPPLQPAVSSWPACAGVVAYGVAMTVYPSSDTAAVGRLIRNQTSPWRCERRSARCRSTALHRADRRWMLWRCARLW